MGEVVTSFSWLYFLFSFLCFSPVFCCSRLVRARSSVVKRRTGLKFDSSSRKVSGKRYCRRLVQAQPANTCGTPHVCVCTSSSIIEMATVCRAAATTTADSLGVRASVFRTCIVNQEYSALSSRHFLLFVCAAHVVHTFADGVHDEALRMSPH